MYFCTSKASKLRTWKGALFVVEEHHCYRWRIRLAFHLLPLASVFVLLYCCVALRSTNPLLQEHHCYLWRVRLAFHLLPLIYIYTYMYMNIGIHIYIHTYIHTVYTYILAYIYTCEHTLVIVRCKVACGCVSFVRRSRMCVPVYCH